MVTRDADINHGLQTALFEPGDRHSFIIRGDGTGLGSGTYPECTGGPIPPGVVVEGDQEAVDAAVAWLTTPG
jgi:hypothetical protein